MKRLAMVLLVALAGCKVAIDFSEGRGYACAPDAGAGQCAAGWRCGLEGYCHREGDAKPWQCQDSADCEAGWRCGLERTCHDPAIASPYLCTDDTWCAAGWRCGFEGRCVDPRLEVSPIAEATPELAEVLAPRLALRPDAGARFVEVVGPRLQAVALARGTVVDVLRPVGSDLLDTSVQRLDAGAPVEAVASLSSNTWVLAGGAVVRWDDQGRAVKQLTRDAGPALLRVGSEPYLLEPARLSRLPVYSNEALPHPVEPEAFDATVLGSCLFQLTPEGLSSANVASATWFPLALDGLVHTTCSSLDRGGLASGRFRISGNGLLAIAAIPGLLSGRPTRADAGEVDENLIMLYDASGLLRRGPSGVACEPEPPLLLEQCGSPRTAALLGPCASPCSFGERVSDLRARRSASGVELEAECTGPRGQSTWRVSGVGRVCAQAFLNGASSRYAEVRREGFESADFGGVMQFGEHGQAWVGETFSQAAAVFLDAPPLGPARLLRADAGAITAWVASDAIAVPNPELGLLNIPGEQLAAAVDGTDDWVVDSNGFLLRLGNSWRGGAAELLGALDVGPDAFRPPIQAQRVALDGEATLIVTVNDALYAAAADEALLAARDVPLRIVPQPGVAITSLAALPGDADGGTTLRGFLSTRTSVMSFTTRSTSWSVQPVAMPPGTVRKVWVDQGRARAGLEDGRVLTLPSRIPIAPAIGEQVVDYLSACGQTWALTATGLLRLTSGAGGQGAWVDWPLPEALRDGLDTGRLFAANGRVFVFNAFGNAVSFAPAGGCP